MQEHCHTKLLATRYSLFAIRYSPFATRCRFGSAGISPSHFLPSRKVIHQSLISIRVHYLPFAAVSTAGGQSRLLFATHYSPLATRHSPSKKFSPTG
jgi:hypothetical protein